MRILVIDDEAGLRKTIRGMLEFRGLEVEEAADGEMGIRAYRQHGADVVLCDLFMPTRDGLETIRELRRLAPHVKIIAMSGGGPRGTVNLLPMARRMGAAEVLYKPFAWSELLAAVDQASVRTTPGMVRMKSGP
jgi:DNA-binding response OmpR family regulator